MIGLLLCKRIPGLPFSRGFWFRQSYTMGKKGSKSGYGAQKQKNQGGGGGGKPRLTHFLCMPLVNQTSIPQLVASLEEFKASIPLISSPSAAGHGPGRSPLVPDGALRPLGTLHLTIGVMSLPTQEQLDEALGFLQSLDITSMMREAEAETRAAPAAQREEEGRAKDLEPVPPTVGPPSPLTVDLTSLHALPSKRSATILHASPVDPTSRLYPFCERLRNKFIEAGFMHQEMIKGSGSKGGHAPRQDTAPEAPAVDDTQNLSRSEGEPLPIRSAMPSQPTASRRPRPLLLHATISNTIYLGRRRNQGEREEGEDGVGGGGGGGGEGRGGNRKKKKEVYKFDATELLSRFGDPSPPVASQQKSSLPRKAIPRNQPFETEDKEPAGSQEQAEVSRSREPFVWAKDIPLDRLCICEMGAKPVPHDESEGGPELGEAYTVVGERKLEFLPGLP